MLRNVDRWLVTDVSGRLIGSKAKQSFWIALTLRMELIGCAETSVTTNLRCVTLGSLNTLTVWKSGYRYRNVRKKIKERVS